MKRIALSGIALLICAFLLNGQERIREGYSSQIRSFNLLVASFELIATNNSPEKSEQVNQKINLVQEIDRENGFYETTNYSRSIANEDIQLADQPALTPADILKVKKSFSSYSGKPEILIQLTEEGAQKLYKLSNENIGKPIAIVIENSIVSMPLVNSEIKGGRMSIVGDFSLEEIDQMIEKLK